MESEERSALARALLTELEGGSKESPARGGALQSAAVSAGSNSPAPLPITARRSAAFPDADADERSRAGESPQSEQTQRDVLLRGLDAISRRRASVFGSVGDAGEGASRQWSPAAMEAAALPDAEAISAAVRRAARCEDGGYERY